MEGGRNGGMDGASSQALLNEVFIREQHPLPATPVPTPGAATSTFQVHNSMVGCDTSRVCPTLSPQ